MAERSCQALAEEMTHHGSDRRGQPLYRLPDDVLALCRKLRTKCTDAEAILWACLRGRQLGTKFRRQHAIGGYIADFYCHEHRLVVELDGDVHDGERQAEHDLRRDSELGKEGYRVLRLRNETVVRNPVAALRLVLAAFDAPKPTPPAPSPKGRGERQRPKAPPSPPGRRG